MAHEVAWGGMLAVTDENLVVRTRTKPLTEARGVSLSASRPALCALDISQTLAPISAVTSAKAAPVDNAGDVTDDALLRALCTVMAESCVDRALTEAVGLATTSAAVSWQSACRWPASTAPSASTVMPPPTRPPMALPPVNVRVADAPMTPSLPRRMAGLEQSHQRLRVRLKESEQSEESTRALLQRVEQSAREQAEALVAQAEAHRAEMAELTAAHRATVEALEAQLRAATAATTAAAAPVDALAGEYRARYQTLLAENVRLRDEADAALRALGEQSREQRSLADDLCKAFSGQNSAIEALLAQVAAADKRALEYVEERGVLLARMAKLEERASVADGLELLVAEQRTAAEEARAAHEEAMRVARGEAQEQQRRAVALETKAALTAADAAAAAERVLVMASELTSTKAALEAARDATAALDAKVRAAEQQLFDHMMEAQQQAATQSAELAAVRQRLEQTVQQAAERAGELDALRALHARDNERLAVLQAAEDETRSSQLFLRQLRADLDAARLTAQQKEAEVEELKQALNKALAHVDSLSSAAASSAAVPDDSMVITVAEYESLNDIAQRAEVERAQMLEFREKSMRKIETLQQNLAKSEQEVSMLDDLLLHTETVLRAHEGLLDVHPDLKDLLWKVSSVEN